MKRDFKGVWIPKEVWLDGSLNINEKVLLVEIHSLDGEAGCYASNAHFVQFLNTSESTLKRSMRKLVSKGYISIPSYSEHRIIHSNLRTMIAMQKQSDKLNDLADEANKHPLVEKIEREFPRVSQMATKISSKNAVVLLEKYGEEMVVDKLGEMENWPDLHKKSNAYLTCNTWCKREVAQKKSGTPAPRRFGGGANKGSDGMVY